MKIRVLHLITGLEQGGAETMLYKLLVNMDREQFQPIVVSMMNEGVFGEKIRGLGILVYCLKMRGYNLRNIACIFQYFCLIRKYKPDVIQSWMYHANVVSLMMKPFFLRAVYINNVRTSLSQPGMMKAMTKLMMYLNGFLSRFSDFCINNSISSQQQHWKLGFSKKKDIYIPNGFSLENFKQCITRYHVFRQEYHLSSNCKLVGIFSRFHKQKNHAGFLRIAKILIEQTKIEWRFVLAGTNCDSSNIVLNEMILQLQLQKYVILLGNIDSKEYLPCLDVYLSTSYTEGFPNIIGEAMSCGVPCVATNVGDCQKIVDVYGYIAEVDDDKTLAEHCVAALECDQQKKYAMIEHIRKNYSIDRIIRQYEMLYHDAYYGMN